ncbi:MAG: histone deacetylase [Nitrospirae bacterium]|nr:MAG: histone deacetylase [Nitrospirota bacterium]
MRSVGYITHDIFLEHRTPAWHPESPERLKAINESLVGSDLYQFLKTIPPRKAEKKEISRVHDISYIERVSNASPGYLDPDTYLSEKTYEAALFAAGAVLTAVDNCKIGEIERAFCAVRPPGHHAEQGRAMGFCVFNNVAVGARYAQRAGYERVFIIDYDVHHGNGTEHAFYDDDTVFYLSTHQYPHYPGTGNRDETGSGRGAGTTRNFPMPAGAGDEEYLRVFKDEVPAIMREFMPDIVIVSAGYDLHVRDPLSEIRVTDEGIRGIVQGILSYGNIPYIFCLEGGYDLTGLSRSVLITIEELLEIG